MPQANPEQYRSTLARLQQFSRWTDSRFRVPLTRIDVGVEALIGLIPGVGDLAGLVLASYVLLEAWRVGAPGRLLGRMLANMLVDAVGGLLPLVGDLFDIWYKANTRNTRLLEQWLNEQLQPEAVRRPAWSFWLAWLLVLTALGVAAYWLSSSSGLLAAPF